MRTKMNINSLFLMFTSFIAPLNAEIDKPIYHENYCINSNPCLNGGKCVNLYRVYVCVCDSLWTGLNCEISIQNHSPINGSSSSHEIQSGGFNDHKSLGLFISIFAAIIGMSLYYCCCRIRHTSVNRRGNYSTVAVTSIPVYSDATMQMPGYGHRVYLFYQPHPDNPPEYTEVLRGSFTFENGSKPTFL